MPDISMCSGVNCNLKETCHRHTAIPNPFRQTYFSKPPVNNTGTPHTCENYWNKD